MTKSDFKKQVVRNLKPLKPEKVILFGSLSTGKFVAGKSDIDLLIIKNTEKNMGDRYVQARLLLPDNPPFDLFVLTPNELKEKLQNSFFFRDIIRYGEVLYEKQA